MICLADMDNTRTVSYKIKGENSTMFVKGGKKMNQVKIGNLIKELRKEKNYTQEQLAEKLGVSQRTVSRWETGHNLPDLDILMEMADFYDVDLRELLDGERKGDKMDKEIEETVMKVAEYSNEEKNQLTRKMSVLFSIGIIVIVVYVILRYSGMADNVFYSKIAAVMLGTACGIMTIGFLFTGGYLVRIKRFRNRLVHKKHKGDSI